MEDHLRGDNVDESRNYELEGEELKLDKTPLGVFITVNADKFTWKSAFKQKAMYFHMGVDPGVKGTLGYRIFWYLYSADIWFGKFPLLKFIVGVNVLIWLVWLWKMV